MRNEKIQELIREGKKIKELIGEDQILAQIVCSLMISYSQNTAASHLSMIKTVMEKGLKGEIKNVS